MAVSPGTVQDCAFKGKTGQAPGRNGPRPALLPEETFAVLLTAFETCIQCNQMNGVSENLNCNDLIAPIQRALDPVQKVGTRIVHRLLQQSNMRFDAEVALENEDRRARWTTHGNIKAWFDNWRMDLERLGFGTSLGSGSFHVPDDQLQQIVNLDESALSLDGNEGRVGGRPRVTRQDPRFP